MEGSRPTPDSLQTVTAERQPQFRAKSLRKNSVRNYLSAKIDRCWCRFGTNTNQHRFWPMSIDLTSTPQDDEQDYYSKDDHKNYEQAYYIGHPARRQGIIDVPIMCFVFISFHVATPLVSVPPLLKIRLQHAIYFCPP